MEKNKTINTAIAYIMAIYDDFLDNSECFKREKLQKRLEEIKELIKNLDALKDKEELKK